MNIIISGYGRMGKEVENAALKQGHQLVCKIDDANGWKDLLKGSVAADVVIDFSQPDAAFQNLLNCFELGIPVVTGTTGWYNRMEEVKAACNDKEGTLFYAPNFSMGVNLFFHFNKQIAKVMSSFTDYRASLSETHHVHKLDAPSGTAIKAAEDLIENHQGLNSWKSEFTTDAEALPVYSHREGEVPGTHIVRYDSIADLIELKHEAKNRSGFAQGAIMAASWVRGKKGIYVMDDLLKSLL